MSIATASWGRHASRALTWTSLLSEPLFTLYSFLPFILYRDLGASPFAIALMTMLKPVVTILSFYWSAGLKGKSRKLKGNVLWAGLWMRAPFLLCPWVAEPWYLIGAAINYMFFYRAQVPGWVEVLKRNIPQGERGRAFSWSAALGYGEGVLLSLGMGALLDARPELWPLLSFGAAAVGLLSLAVQAQVEVPPEEQREEPSLSLPEIIARPWRDSWRLVRSRPDFARFQWGFMAAGFGIMLIQPALTFFAVDQLHVGYLQMAGALSIAKGLGFVVSSPVWGRAIEGRSVFPIASCVFACMGAFPLLLAAASWEGSLLYCAYFVYGIGQGGSHLVWHLSGPHFAGSEESSRYSGVNVAMAGLRGAVAPPLGGVVAVEWGAVPTLLLGGVVCLLSALQMRKPLEKKEGATVWGR
jgi:predicted MFS family arabinose efflux permease